MTDPHDLIYTETVLLPLYAWSLDVRLEEDRPLARMEQAVLRLCAAGVRRLPRLQQLLGLEDQRLLVRTVGRLRLRDALTATDGAYSLTPYGTRLLRQAEERVPRLVNLTLWHDPYRDDLVWPYEDDEQVLDHNEAKASPHRVLVAPAELRVDEVRGRQRTVQARIDEDGLPGESEITARQQRERHRAVISVEPRHPIRLYVPAILEVHLHQRTRALQYRLLRDGREDERSTATLLEFVEVLPSQVTELVPLTAAPPLAPLADVLEAAETAARSGLELPRREAVERPVLTNILSRATGSVVLMTSFLRAGQVDTALLAALRRQAALEPGVRITVMSAESGRLQEAKLSREVSRHLAELQAQHTETGRFRYVGLPSLPLEGIAAEGVGAVFALPRVVQQPAVPHLGLPYTRYVYVGDAAAVQAFLQAAAAIVLLTPSSTAMPVATSRLKS